MIVSLAVPIAARLRRVDRPRFDRVVRTSLVIAGVALCSTNSVAAQTIAPATRSWELRAPSGALVPTGDQRHFVKDARVTAAQLSWVVRPRVALTGTFAWAPSRDLASADAPRLDVFTSDFGVEARSADRDIGESLAFRTFAGLGAGVRIYNHRTVKVDATSRPVGYGSVGGELVGGRAGLRLEVRDYVTRFQPLTGTGNSQWRNDVVVMASLSIRVRRAGEAQE